MVTIYSINSQAIKVEMITPSPDPPLCNSLVFRMKQKQHLTEKQTDIKGMSDIETPFEKFQIRSVSPLPVLLLTDESDESDENDCSINIEGISNNYLAQPRLSRPIIHPGYQRIKSRSVKLLSVNENNSCPKKTVRFADDFGLEFIQMKLIDTDELPHVPREAFKHLMVNNDNNSLNQERVIVIIYMEPQFQNPIYMQDFKDRVSQNKVLLEQANAINRRIYGTIRLISLSLHKQVKIRITTDNWISFKDHDAIYINNSYDGIHDRFSCTIKIDRHRICIENNIQFCIYYESFGDFKYWDNNYQQNYRFNFFSRTVPD